MESLCPARNYMHCFNDALTARYPMHNLFIDATPLVSAPENARTLLPQCADGAGDYHSGTSTWTPPHAGGDGVAAPAMLGTDESFVLSALSDAPRGSEAAAALPLARATALRERLRRGLARRGGLPGELRCASPSRTLDSHVVAMLGIPTSHQGAARRDAARRSWLARAP